MEPRSPATTTADLIRTAGARATPARVRVLELLGRAQQALSHHDIEARLGAGGLDRVTLYRVLDWLVASGLAHRSVDEARVSRFSAAAGDRTAHRRHAHFHCHACRRVFCLEDVPARLPALPAGFHAGAVEVAVRGRCADCAASGEADHAG